MNKYETWDRLKEPLPEIDSIGSMYWRNKDGQMHREGAPAITWRDGSEFWYLYGFLHKLDGPAVMYANQNTQWWINGKQYTQEKYNEQIRNME